MISAADRQKDMPILVYLTTNTEKFATEQDVIEQTTLKDERVSLASKMFVMVKANGDEIDQNHVFGRFLDGSKLPRFVLFSSDGERIGKLEGRASPSKLYGLMKKAANRTYVTRMDTFVKDYQKVLTSLDKLDALKNALAQKEARDDSARGKREVEKKRAEYEQQEEELREAEQELLDFKRRAA